MPFSKEKNRRIYITAFVISFFLIVGSIYLHLRQKTHLGRMSFNLDRDRIKPTSGVDIDAVTKNDYDSKYKKTYAYDYSDEDNYILEESSADNNNNDDDTLQSNSKQYNTDEDIDEDNDDVSDDLDDIDDNNDKIIDNYSDGNIDADIDDNSESEIDRTDSDFCLRCLCMTVNECRTTYCTSENPCGLYKISKLYWIDGGKPTIAGGSIDNEDQDYLTCVNDANCSATTIRQYYNRYKRDCNKDGKFNCEDLIMLHFMGPSGCLTQNLSYLHTNRMNKCFNETHFHYSFSEEEDEDY